MSLGPQERYWIAVARRQKRDVWLWRLKMAALVVLIAVGVKYVAGSWF
jgi:hypothetical protein